ncbi:protein-glutamate methylesterase/protein-glutamine glutaminase [Nitrincola sp. MINF-07-Sa-05]|uniref:protein-glutamate methylesterase/protein-glutamine glutaminase n=1 Tax=Nitrincola salilacus TaxID=3400273 RepID=UPI00391835D0
MKADKTGKVSVIVVDDSALVRQLLTELLNADPDIEVVATAADPYLAREKIKRFNPDVITLDIEMPRMDGLTFLRNLMRLRPMPVVMVSTLTEQGAQATLDALELGAFDFVAKPKQNLANTLVDFADDICASVKAAARSSTSSPIRDTTRVATPGIATQVISRPMLTGLRTTEKIVAIGASTGGVEAIRQVLSSLPSDAPGIVITQHIPGAFSEAFAKRINGLTAMEVRQAEDGAQILPGHVYIAPGDRHLLVRRSGARYYCQLDDGAPVFRHKPSVDVLFRSVAEQVGANAIGVMLTGMGEDGAQGMLRMKHAGAVNLAQDERTSVVWGMPSAAIKAGAVDEVYPLSEIASYLMAHSRQN